MARQYFGTDGIRGLVGKEPMTAEFALRLASAAARVLAPDGGRGHRQGHAGVRLHVRVGARGRFRGRRHGCSLLGPLPTPGIAYLTQALEADLGVVISASHNPYYDNGIKFFDGQGAKLPDEVEEPSRPFSRSRLSPVSRRRWVGRSGLTAALEDYQRFCIGTVPPEVRLDRLKIVVDCSHGAAYKVAPRVLTELGAKIVPIGCSPNGRNINDDCGSTNPELLHAHGEGVGAQISASRWTATVTGC